VSDIGSGCNPIAVSVLTLNNVERVSIGKESRLADLGGESLISAGVSITLHAGSAGIVTPSDHFTVGREICISESITNINDFLIVDVFFVVDSIDGELAIVGYS